MLGWRKLMTRGVQLGILFVLYLGLSLVLSRIGVPPEASAQMTPAQAQTALLGLVVAAVINTGLVAYLVLRSRWHGWQLALTVGLVFYGVFTFLQQLELLAFPAVADRMPAGLLASVFWTGALFAAILAPLAVLLLGQWRAPAVPEAPNTRLVMPAREWAWKLAGALVLYEAIYFVFGYYVAWRTPGLPEFYGGSDPGTLLGQLGNVLRDTPWLPLFQALRALLWTLCVLPVIRMLKGPGWEAVLAVGLLLSLMVAGQLLIPNPFWPEFVGRAHLVELATSNFVFGVLVSAWLLWRPRRALPVPMRAAGQPRPL